MAFSGITVRISVNPSRIHRNPFVFSFKSIAHYTGLHLIRCQEVIMIRKRTLMTNIKEVLRLKHECHLSTRQIAPCLNIGRSTVSDALNPFKQSDHTCPLPVMFPIPICLKRCIEKNGQSPESHAGLCVLFCRTQAQRGDKAYKAELQTLRTSYCPLKLSLKRKIIYPIIFVFTITLWQILLISIWTCQLKI